MPKRSRRQRVAFANGRGSTLAGILELPEGGEPRAQALYASCFTCGKDVLSAARVSRGLAERGIAVLRFDFTGLGDSEGNFSDTNFSGNVQDLLAAAAFLKDQGRPVDLLLGHSLGGAAALAAARDMPEAKALVTIAAPADPEHVLKQLGCSIDTIRAEGQAEVELARRTFLIKRQFVDDLDQHKMGYIHDLQRPLLIYHSPLDQTVSIHEAADIYSRAKHPKSFISLDHADHLLTGREDAAFVASTLAAWSEPYLAKTDV